MKKMFFHGVDQNEGSDMQEDSAEKSRNGNSDGGDKGGDGLHHHEIHEDEGGGYHSVHTHPDGNEEHDDHASYEEARDKMDADFGKGDGAEDDSGDGGDGGDMSTEDIAGSYGRQASCD